MSENQPREFDAALGGKNPPPVTGVVLGGIEGVKRRLESEIVDVRIKALNDALNYGDEGLDLVIQALENDSLQVKSFASRLLKKSGGEKGKQALLEFDPYLYFTKLIGITLKSTLIQILLKQLIMPILFLIQIV